MLFMTCSCQQTIYYGAHENIDLSRLEEHQSRQYDGSYHLTMFTLLLEGVLSHSSEPRIVHRSSTLDH
jgi:hypothetical protein